MSITIYPTLHFLARPDLTPRALTVSRSGIATRTDAQGKVAVASANVLRHDFDAQTGVYRGWLVEEGRVNHIVHCRDLTNAVWTRNNVDAVRNARGADGIDNTASTVTANAANATVFQTLSGLSSQTTPYTLSFDLKRRSGHGAVFATLDGGTTWDNISALIATERFARVSLSASLDAPPKPGLKIAANGDSLIVDYAQLEEGAFITSRIPTEDAPAQRGGDSLSADAGDGWFNPDEGAVYVEGMLATASDTPKTLFSSSGAAVEASVSHLSDGLQINAGAIGSGFSHAAAAAVRTGTPLRLCLVYHATHGGAFIQDGTAVHSFSAGKRWNAERLAFGCQLRDGPQRFVNGWISHAAVFPRRLPDAQAKELTTP